MKKFIVPVLLGGGVLAAFIGLLPNILAGLDNNPPRLAVEYSAVSGEAPLRVVVNADTTDPDNDEVEISWFLGSELRAKGSLTTYDFQFDQPGEYEIVVFVTDGEKFAQKKQLVIVKAPVKEIVGLDLDAPLRINDPSSDYRLTGEIITRGHDISIIANRLLGTVQIRSFPAGRAANVAVGITGRSGRNGIRGRGSDWEDGQDGESGERGKTGQHGMSAGSISITASEISSNLIVSNRGQSGGKGGDGGAGGNGGNGAQGTPSVAGVSIMGNKVCKSRAGQGGQGGNGGSGGAGGRGGNGGDGGAVIVQARSVTGTITIRTSGGQPGLPGDPGNGGRRGTGGPEGAVNGPCQSAGQLALDGYPGRLGYTGETGLPGAHGVIEVTVEGILRKSTTAQYEFDEGV